jgi:hypothetical protein
LSYKAGEDDVDMDVTEPEDTADASEKPELESDERELEREWAGDDDLKGGKGCVRVGCIHVGEVTSSVIIAKSFSSSSWSTSKSC